MKVAWTSEAIQSLQDLHEYIAQDSLKAADKIVARIFSETRYLGNFPGVGRRGRVKGTRELIVSKTSYIIAYHVGKTEVQILAVQHGAQQWPDSF